MTTTVHPLFKTAVPAGWRVLTVDDIKAPEKSSCVAGPFGSNIGSKYFVASGVPIIRGNNLRDDLTRFVPNGFAFVSEEQATQYKAQHVQEGDLVFTCWGTIGQVGLIPKDGPYPEYIISNKQLKLRPNKEAADSVYLFFYFACPQMVEHVLGKAIGAAVPGINLGILKQLPVVLPPLPVQHRIAGILSDYDELIKNNQRRIKILEEMARSLYREWFVHFRFPGHDKVKMVPSPLGLIPQRWKIKAVKEVLARRPAGQVYREEGVVLGGTVPVIDQSTNELLGFHDNDPDHLATPENPIAIFGDHTCKMQLLVEPFSIGPNVVAFEANVDRPISYLFHIVRSLVQTQEYKRHWSQLTAKEIVLADKSTAEHFATSIQPSLQEVDVLRKASRVLRRTRDLLLPRLLSGAIELASAGISATQEIA